VALKVYNTLSRQKEEFVPWQPGLVTMYVCGVTVYASSHIGHAMSALTFDMIRRYLEYRDYQVKHVINFTDIDDKIIQRAQAEQVDWRSLTERYIRQYLEWMDALNVKRATVYPRATEEINTIVGWVDQGAAEGDPKHLPPIPAYIEGWRIGTPDQVFSMSEEHVIEPDAPDDYFVFTIPTRFNEDKWVQAAEIRPSNRRVVHHAIAHILTPQTIARSRQGTDRPAAKAPGSNSPVFNSEAEPPIFYRQGSLSRVKMDAPVMDDGARAINGGSLFKRSAGNQGSDLFSILLTSYAPGKGPDVYDRGMAKRIPAGSIIVLQIHYSSFRRALDKPTTDRTSLGLIFAGESPATRVVTLTVPNHFFKIPPGAGNHEVTAAYTFEEDVRLINYMPHMHLRGKDMKYEALYPDGRRETLLWVPSFNFNWQTTYYLKTPISIPMGTKVIITAHFDNSARNKYNPDPTRAVRWGDPTYDEMMIGWMEYVVPNSSNNEVK